MASEISNLNGEEDVPIRQCFARKKSKASETSAMAGGKSKKKKLPQRGMGVAKLELKRIQEEWEKMKENSVNLDHRPFVHHFPSSDLPFGIANHSGFVACGLISKELSSSTSSVNCSSLHCNACHKKKKVVNGMNFGCDIHLGVNLNSIGNGNKGIEMEKKDTKMVMEYEFFPSHSKSDDESVMISSYSSSSNPKSLDLSLKL